MSRPSPEAAVAVLCAYEAVAITSRRVPTVSAPCRRHRWVEAALLAALLVHLHAKIAGVARELESCEWEAQL